MEESKQILQEENTEYTNIYKINLNSNTTKHNNIIYEKIFNNIKQGNINPEGPLLETPKNIKISLKKHQQRILYEMLEKENIGHRVTSGINAFVLADNVGSGKSIDVLSLIAHKPIITNLISNKLIYNTTTLGYLKFNGFTIYPTIEFKSNLIVIPHSIYNQWLNYIVEFTNLTFLGISKSKDIENLDYQKLVDGDYNILLVKSTKFNNLMKSIYEKYNYTIYHENNINNIDLEPELNRFIQENRSFSIMCKNKSNIQITTNFLESFLNLKDIINGIDLDIIHNHITKNNGSQYPLNNNLRYSGPIFQRVFIDEANSIHIPACQPVYGKINWFITSSVENLLYPIKNSWQSFYNTNTEGIRGSGFIRNTFLQNSGQYMCNFIQDMFLKNKDTFIRESFLLEEPQIFRIECYTPPHLRILENIAMPDVIQALNAGDIDSALNAVGCNISNQENIVESVLKDFNIKYNKKIELVDERKKILEQIILDIEFVKNKIIELNNIYNNEEVNETTENIKNEIIEKKDLLEKLRSKKSNLKKKINEYNEDIVTLKYKIDSITTRISDIEYKECPICAQIVNNPCVTPCCNNIFCLSCLAQAFEYTSKNKCPLCRNQDITISSVTAIVNKELVKETKVKYPTKIDTLINIISNTPDGKFLIFSEYYNSFNEIVNYLTQSEIPFSTLKGSTGHISNIINQYKSGEIKILLLNARHFGSGLNLQMTTDIIIYHKMSSELENQVIGRGQRVGRETRLNVLHLCYNNEMI